MTFFEPPARRPEPEHPPPPAWFGPATDEVAVVIPIERMLARTDSAAVSVRSFAVQSHGFSVGLAVRVKARPDTDPFYSAHTHVLIQAGSDVPDEFLRFGVEFADGSKATNLEDFPGRRGAAQASGALRTRRELWIWPCLPRDRSACSANGPRKAFP